MPRTVQLRRYNLKPHLVEEFLVWWPSLLVPARATFGFTVESAYLNRQTAEVTWAVSADGTRRSSAGSSRPGWTHPAHGRVRWRRRLERLDRHRAGRADRLDWHAARARTLRAQKSVNTGVGSGDVHASVVSRIAIVSVTGSVHHVEPRPPSQP